MLVVDMDYTGTIKDTWCGLVLVLGDDVLEFNRCVSVQLT